MWIDFKNNAIFDKVLNFVKTYHWNQKRDDWTPYFDHLLNVAIMLYTKFSVNDNYYLSLAFLHDILEDTNVDHQIIIDEFGVDFYNDLLLLSHFYIKDNDKIVIPVDIYYNNLLKANYYVKLIKIADRIDNLLDMKWWKIARKIRKIEETELYVIPLAESMFEISNIPLKNLNEAIIYKKKKIEQEQLNNNV